MPRSLLASQIKRQCTSDSVFWIFGWLLIFYASPASGEFFKCQLPKFSNANLTVFGQRDTDDTVLPRTFVVINCNAGYVLSDGLSVSQCGDLGQWNGAFGTCRLVTDTQGKSGGDCRTNLLIRNGFLVATKESNSYRIQCLNGFILNGPEIVRCTDETSWTYPGQCEKRAVRTAGSVKQCFVPDITAALISVNNGPNFLAYRFQVPAGTKITLTCAKGYAPVGLAVSTCIGDDVWAPQTPSCITVPSSTTTTTTAAPITTTVDEAARNFISRIWCELPVMEGGQFFMAGYPTQSRFVTTGTVVSLQCNERYILQGGATTSFCQVDGTWSNPFGDCRLVWYPGSPISSRCVIYRPENGFFLFNGVKTQQNEMFQLFPRTSIVLKCEPGYEVVSGPSESNCTADGTLSTTLGHCAPKTIFSTASRSAAPHPVEPIASKLFSYCNVTQPLYGSLTLDKTMATRGLQSDMTHKIGAGTRVTLRCFLGYSIAKGPDTALCQEDGSLSAQLGECQRLGQVEMTMPFIWKAAPPIFMKKALIATRAPAADNIMAATTTTTITTTSTTTANVIPKDLFDASIVGDWHRAALIVSKLTNRDVRDQSDRSALMLAARYGNANVVKLLLDNGARIDSIDSNGHTALMHACQNGKTEVVKLLLASGANANLKWGDTTALILATQNGYSAIVQLLLEKQIFVDDFDRSGATALIWAARNGHRAIVQYILNKGANVNAADFDGMTALMWAARNGFEDIVTRLVEGGADTGLKDVRGRSALNWAELKGQVRIFQILDDQRHFFRRLVMFDRYHNY